MIAEILSIALACGKERWAVKTLTDPGAALALSPVVASVDGLRALPAPPYDDKAPRWPQERAVYRVTALLMAMKREADQDFHVVIADPWSGGTMVVEFPDPDCLVGSRAAQEIGEARRALLRATGGAPGKGLRRFRRPLLVEVTGVLFFDRCSPGHHPTGAAPQCVELHPVTGFSVVGAGRSPAPADSGSKPRAPSGLGG